eukprot:3695059-Rhodomonas_salina.1
MPAGIVPFSSWISQHATFDFQQCSTVISHHDASSLLRNQSRFRSQARRTWAGSSGSGWAAPVEVGGACAGLECCFLHLFSGCRVPLSRAHSRDQARSVPYERATTSNPRPRAQYQHTHTLSSSSTWGWGAGGGTGAWGGGPGAAEGAWTWVGPGCCEVGAGHWSAGAGVQPVAALGRYMRRRT